MNKDMVAAAHELFAAAERYQALYKAKYNKNDPVVWVVDERTPKHIFIADGYNGVAMMKELTSGNWDAKVASGE